MEYFKITDWWDANKNYILTVFASGLVFFIIILIGYLMINKEKESEVSIECCNGSSCSDTYYTPKNNLCHLSLCESSIGILNKSQCVYRGANITINWSDQ